MTNPVRLTDRFVASLKPADRRMEYPDSIQTGLALRVTPKGAKSWAVRYWRAGKSVRTTLGSWPETSLAQARELAAEARVAKQRGGDPRAALRGESKPAAPTLRVVAKRWVTDQNAQGRRSTELRYRLLDLHVPARLLDAPVDEKRQFGYIYDFTRAHAQFYGAIVN